MIVLFADIGKGAAAVALAGFLGSPFEFTLVAGVVAVLGHVFTVFLKFRGGRGGATCIGVLVFLMPWAIPAYLAIMGIVLLITRFPTLSYGIAFISFPIIGWFVYNSSTLLIYSLCIVVLLALGYLRRVKQMRSKSGNWKQVFVRKSVKERL